MIIYIINVRKADYEEVELGSIVFSETEIELAVDIFLQSQHHSFLRSKENVNLNKYQHFSCVGVEVPCDFLWTQV